MNWRAEVPAIQLPHRFAPDPGPDPRLPYQSVACDQPECRRPSFGHPTRCELHRHRGGNVLADEVAALIGPTNAARQSEERGPR